MHQEFINIFERFKPSNAQIIYNIKNDVNLRKNELMDEFYRDVKKKYGSDINIVDQL
jgi:hypothetical protein